MKYYSTFGLTLSSDIPLDLYEIRSSHHDITIALDAPTSASGNKDWDITGSPDDITFFWTEAGYFRIHSGKAIDIRPIAQCGEGILEDSILGECLGTALIQRNELVLHASAIDTGDGALVFIGDSGLGKSTLAYLALQNGGRVLGDDVCLIRFQGSTPYVIPGPSWLKVREQAIMAAGESVQGRSIAFEGSEKYKVRSEAATQSIPIRRIMLLESAADLTLSACSDVSAFWGVMENSFASHLAESYDYSMQCASQKKQLFQQCEHLVRVAEVSILSRSQSLPTPAELAALLH